MSPVHRSTAASTLLSSQLSCAGCSCVCLMPVMSWWACGVEKEPQCWNNEVCVRGWEG